MENLHCGKLEFCRKLSKRQNSNLQCEFCTTVHTVISQFCNNVHMVFIIYHTYDISVSRYTRDCLETTYIPEIKKCSLTRQTGLIMIIFYPETGTRDYPWPSIPDQVQSMITLLHILLMHYKYLACVNAVLGRAVLGRALHSFTKYTLLLNKQILILLRQKCFQICISSFHIQPFVMEHAVFETKHRKHRMF